MRLLEDMVDLTPAVNGSFVRPKHSPATSFWLQEFEWSADAAVRRLIPAMKSAQRPVVTMILDCDKAECRNCSLSLGCVVLASDVTRWKCTLRGSHEVGAAAQSGLFGPNPAIAAWLAGNGLVQQQSCRFSEADFTLLSTFCSPHVLRSRCETIVRLFTSPGALSNGDAASLERRTCGLVMAIASGMQAPLATVKQLLESNPTPSFEDPAIASNLQLFLAQCDVVQSAAADIVQRISHSQQAGPATVSPTPLDDLPPLPLATHSATADPLHMARTSSYDYNSAAATIGNGDHLFDSAPPSAAAALAPLGLATHNATADQPHMARTSSDSFAAATSTSKETASVPTVAPIPMSPQPFMPASDHPPAAAPVSIPGALRVLVVLFSLFVVAYLVVPALTRSNVVELLPSFSVHFCAFNCVLSDLLCI